MDSKEIEKRRLTLDDHMHHTKDGVEFWYAREVMGGLRIHPMAQVRGDDKTRHDIARV